ncbi:hypothetical protein G647_06784 [Cladophialophora carrionii CBS 160.54]|uniref:Tachykinin family protein n=1 Tax=Cladophialophora carrionii CBS 160.54 TaxID=1279043 RepID=V9D8S0_9EURO|nr:uncharacterized protein G647_06784 [Cladophialophora carrionii CBS 160.54]ETI22708.1 hypothetical protein G647_06784 [Cladophialophora carrionii CBS 160.54]
MAASTQPDRELHFVAVRGQKSRSSSDKKDRSSVRAFVMRDYLRQKSDPTWSFTPAKVADQMRSHISRFRTTRITSAAGPRKRKMAMALERRAEKRTRTQRPLIPAPVGVDERSSTRSSLHDLDMTDPFCTLEVDLSGSDSQNLLQYYHTGFWANSYACNPEARWISVALMDPAIIHATLSLVAIHRRDCFSIDLSNVYFKHRGEAMRIVARRLSNLKESLSYGTIGAVALLSSSDNHFEWSSEAQSTHSQGLGHLIALRGGMEMLSSNRHIQRVAGWADLLQSAMHGTCLQVEMPAAVQESSAEDIDLNVSDDEAGELLTGIVLQDLPPTVGDTVQQLRILSSVKVYLLRERHEELCRVFSNLLWKLEHSILSRSQNPQLTIGTETGSRDDTLKQDLISSVVDTAALILSYLTLRDLAAPIVYRRLSGRLQGHLETLLLFLEQEGGLGVEEDEFAILLWSFFLGWRGSNKDETQAWFTGRLAQLCWRHGILSYETVRARIQSVIPQAHGLVDVPEEFWTQTEDVIWSDMLSLNNVGFGAV